MAATVGSSIRARVRQRPQPSAVVTSDRLIWDPAGTDRMLSSARQDVRAGRFTAARDLLIATGRDWDTRCQRLLILAQAGLDGVATEAWVQEEPKSPHAQMLYARVQVLQAVAAARSNSPAASILIDAARLACHQARECSREDDPAPWVALLHLAGVYPVRQEPPDAALAGAQGPWFLMQTVWSLDAYNREAHQRMLVAVQTASGDGAMYAVARWLAGHAPGASEMHLLPLLARVNDLRKALADTGGNPHLLRLNRELQWTNEMAFQEITRAFEQWFALADPSQRPLVLTDLHVLAHAAYMARTQASLLPVAKAVLTRAGPYACSSPWELTAMRHDGAAELLMARRVCGAGPSH
jgi:hypothetical protein